MEPLDLILLILATWRLAHMVTREDGPFDVFLRLRTRVPLGGLLDCPYCFGMWAAAFWLLLWFHPEWPWAYPLLLVFALAGGALGFGKWSGADIR